MHHIGLEGDNAFSNVTKVSEIQHTDPSHPACGLKRDIIRLIANMAFRNKAAQDLVCVWESLYFVLFRHHCCKRTLIDIN